MKLPLCLAFALTLCTAHAETGKELWERVRVKYTSCASFSCTGKIESTLARPGDEAPYSSQSMFLVRFQRPQSLLVEWSSTSRAGHVQRGALYTREGKTFGVPGYKPEEEEFSSLEMGIGAYAGISGASTYFLPSLLLDKSGYFSGATFESANPGEIKVTTPKSGNWLMTLDPATLAILRILKTHVVSPAEDEARRKEMAEILQKKGLPAEPPKVANGYEITTITTFSEATFDPVLAPGDFVFKKD